LTDLLAINKDCLYQGNTACSESHLFVLEKVIYTDNYSVIL